ncbi:hypothetical protein KAU85_05110, partial [Candidatus Bathyarchaeota archaeon]|nr:hypothetical protein [Candidatus Bathyarchaeota archaeon]
FYSTDILTSFLAVSKLSTDILTIFVPSLFSPSNRTAVRRAFRVMLFLKHLSLTPPTGMS